MLTRSLCVVLVAFGYWFVFISGDYTSTSSVDVAKEAPHQNHHRVSQPKQHPLFQEQTRAVTDEIIMEVASSFNEFGLDLFNTLSSVESGNVLISPLSIATALSMVAAGTTVDSTNAQQFDKTLRLPVTSDSTRDTLRSALQRVSSVDPKVKLLLANSQWTRGSIKESYKKQLSEVFDAEVRELPESPAPINEWVSDNTGGLIEKILDEVDPLAVAVLINAVYFKGEWANKFDKDNTRDMKFLLPSGTSTPCKVRSQHSESPARVKTIPVWSTH
jgi:serpin B